MLRESDIKLTRFDKFCECVRLGYYICSYGLDGAEKKINAELAAVRKENRLLQKLQRKVINESKGGKMCKRITR